MLFSVLKFWFSRLTRGWKGKKWPKMMKISVCCTLYFRNHRSYDLHLWYTCMYKRIMSPGIFFHVFLRILIFGIIREELGLVKGQQIAQNDKTLCLSHLVFQEPYIIYCDFLLHLCKMMISPANFLIFQNFNFWGFSWIS